MVKVRLFTAKIHAHDLFDYYFFDDCVGRELNLKSVEAYISVITVTLLWLFVDMMGLVIELIPLVVIAATSIIAIKWSMLVANSKLSLHASLNFLILL